jgi:hypothetical protein
MKPNTASYFKNASAAHMAQKVPHRNSGLKHAAHRYERRKVREILRHGVDSAEESSRFDRFGE